MRKRIIHHSATSKFTTFASINNYHKKLWNFKSSLGYYAGYHYVITHTGKLIQARAETEAGAHAIGFNNDIGICLIGNFETGKPTRAQLKTLSALLSGVTEIFGHKELSATLCPGKNLQAWIDTYKKLEPEPTTDKENIKKQIIELLEKI